MTHHAAPVGIASSDKENDSGPNSRGSSPKKPLASLNGLNHKLNGIDNTPHLRELLVCTGDISTCLAHGKPINGPTAGAQAYHMDGIGRLGRDPPREAIHHAGGTNGLTCLPMHGGARDNKFLVTHPMTDHCESLDTSETPIAENKYRDPGYYLEPVRVNGTTGPGPDADKGAVPSVVRGLASALLQVEQAIHHKYIKRPLGLDDKERKDREARNKPMDLEALERWEVSLMECRSFAQGIYTSCYGGNHRNTAFCTHKHQQRRVIQKTKFSYEIVAVRRFSKKENGTVKVFKTGPHLSISRDCPIKKQRMEEKKNKVSYANAILSNKNKNDTNLTTDYQNNFLNYLLQKNITIEKNTELQFCPSTVLTSNSAAEKDSLQKLSNEKIIDEIINNDFI
ncbi:hypothetical protein evm_014348 [Chilo suppressalis]|nr:hypothetical protein evm_014348 [Chilo suppressalis]